MMHFLKKLSPQSRMILAFFSGILLLMGVINIMSSQELENNLPNKKSDLPITSFEECVEAGNAVMESYPRQCRAHEKTFVENIGNILEKQDLIELHTPSPNQIIQSPLQLSGRARGYWFFEGNFPVILTDWDGRIIAEGFATAKDEWMTEEFVPFSATLEFEMPEYGKMGTLILRKSNPSDLEENDDALEVPVRF